MVSDIKGLDQRQLPGARTGETGGVRAGTRGDGAARTGAGTNDDTVELSGVAELVRSAARRMASGAPVDEARVRELRQAIADGSYTLDPARIARKLIDADTQF
ncbi:MAG: hypothetical protein CALGDGBN_01189 [Pseudomonadales bacterium]|nr:hypothetical protein [Pseudomonadales bacterium]